MSDTMGDEFWAPGFLPAGRENKPEYDEIDVSSAGFWRQDAAQRDVAFQVLRERRPVSWQRPAEALIPDPDDPGFWAVTRHAEICEVSRNPQTFISGQGVMFDNLPPIVLEMALSFEAMDGERHAQFRRLVSAAFTPRHVAHVEDRIGAIARRCVNAVAGLGRVDFVSTLAGALPLMTFCDIMGVPEELRETVGVAVADGLAWADPEVLAGRDPIEVQAEACLALHEVSAQMYEERIKRPSADLFTALVNATVDGQRLDDGELGAVFTLLAIATTDTTKHTASFAALGMSEYPEQRAWLLEDFDGRIGQAVEEMLRYGTVVMNLRRTAAVETRLGGMRIMPGDKVVMFYTSANRDEVLFPEPERLNFSRDPNPHVAFGGGGAHFCFGAGLARSMLRALFREILTRIPDFAATNPRYLGTNFMRGITHLDFEFTPSRTWATRPGPP